MAFLNTQEPCDENPVSSSLPNLPCFSKINDSGLDKEKAKGTIRLSFGRNNSQNDIDVIIGALGKILS